MHVLVLTAIDVEARGLARHLGLARVERTEWPHYRAGALEITCVGLRAARLEERVDEWARPGVVVSAGACGALAPKLATGDLVVPETVIAPDTVAPSTGVSRPPNGCVACALSTMIVVVPMRVLWPAVSYATAYRV